MMSKPKLFIATVAAVGLAAFFDRAEAQSDPEPVVAVIGDSLATGAATHPALTFDALDLWRVFSGDVSVAVPEPAPRRLWPSAREYMGGPEWVFRHALGSLSRAYLDTEQYSWGYELATSWGVSPRQLVIAGEDGARTSAIPRHVDRVLDATGGRLPPHMFLFYTGNDLCGPGLGFVTGVSDYRRQLLDGLRYIMKNGTPAGDGSTVYVLGYLSVLQLLHSEPILEKKVKAFGAELTCRDLRAQGYRPKDPAFDPGLPPEAWYFSMLMPPNPAAFCPTLFGQAGVPGQTRDETIGTLANRIRDYRTVQREVVDQVNREAKDQGLSGLRFVYLPSTADLLFDPDDIAGDCFHLSRSGQAKVAAAVRSALAAPQAPPAPAPEGPKFEP